MHVRAFIQGRMTSARFPGKVLAPFRGRPILAHVVERVGSVVGADAVVVLTSSDPTDDPVAAYARELGASCFRGDLEDVFARFRACALSYPCDWILRMSADSPLLDPDVLRRILACADDRYDLISTIHPRTFPKGQNAEAIRARALLAVDASALSDYDREHVTPWFYANDTRFRILNVESRTARSEEPGYAVDTLDDLRRLEALPAGKPARV